MWPPAIGYRANTAWEIRRALASGGARDVPFNFLDMMDYSDREFEALAQAVKSWCQSNDIDPESERGRAAAAVAIELFNRNPNLSSKDLQQALAASSP